MNINYKDANVLVIGLAKSGMAAIKVLHKLGANITLSEIKMPNEDDLAILKSFGVKIVGQEMSVFEKDYDLVIKNPGIAPISPIVKKLQEKNIPIITEIELAFKVSKPQHYLAITGTNGKTTTTTLLYEILKKKYGDKALVGGNIGTPLCDLVLQYNLFENDNYYIALEISNNQLVDIDLFKPELSTIINLTPDHLENMGSLDNYYKSKTRVYENMNNEDTFFYNLDDETIKEYTTRYPIKCNIDTFSLIDKDAYAHIDDDYIIINNEKVLPLKKIHLVGEHNIQNVMVATMFAKKLNIENDIIIDVVDNFKGVAHRIEYVREVKGVKYYNDSKGTNTDATITALKAFDKNVILLVGGYEKGLDMSELRKHLGCVKTVIGFGASGKRIANDLCNDPIVVTTLDEAVEKAYYLAASGDTVLLSPTTSSFDQYKSYSERGEHFKKLVNAL